MLRQEKPEVPVTEDRSRLIPPAYKDIERPTEKPSKIPKSQTIPIAKAKVKKPAATISTGEKVRAQVLRVEGDLYHVRLLEKDVGREMSFTRSYIRIEAGDTIEIRIQATNPARDEVTKIEFVKKVTK